jgi:hypothetical protein
MMIITQYKARRKFARLNINNFNTFLISLVRGILAASEMNWLHNEALAIMHDEVNVSDQEAGSCNG